MTGVRKVSDGTHRRGVVNRESFAKRLAADGDSSGKLGG